MGRLQDLSMKLGKMISILGISDPDEVQRKKVLYQQQRAARLAKQSPTPPSATSADAAPPPTISTKP